MKRVWQLQEAKNKFSEVVEEALSQGPQKAENALLEFNNLSFEYDLYCCGMFSRILFPESLRGAESREDIVLLSLAYHGFNLKQIEL